MSVADELEANLPVAMTMAAFVGISWYIAVELNVRLFVLFRFAYLDNSPLTLVAN